MRSPVDRKVGRQIALRASKAFVREPIRISEWSKREAAREKEWLGSSLRKILGDETFERFLILVD